MSNVDERCIFGAVQVGKRYPISLSKEDGRLLTLQYLFKPANVANPVGGQMNGHSDTKSNDVTVTLQSTEGIRETFKGTKRESTAVDHECLLTFSDGVFKVQKVDEMVFNLRVQREENITKSKESSSKESKALLDSRKLPKFLQKSQPKKQAKTVTPKDAPTTEQLATTNNTNEDTTGQISPKTEISNEGKHNLDGPV